MSPRLVSLALAALFLPESIVGPARAAPSAEETPVTLVQVYVAGSDEVVACTRVTVQELLARLELPVIVRDAAGSGEALVHGGRTRALVNAYVDLRSLSEPRVIVVDGMTGTELERRALPAATSTETGVEAASHVLYAAVESAVRARADEQERRRTLAAGAAGGMGATATGSAATPASAGAAKGTTTSATAATTSAGPSAAPAPLDAPEPEERVASSPGEAPESDVGTALGARRKATWGANAGVFATAASFGPSRVLGGAGVNVEAAPQRLAVYPGILATAALFAPGEVGDGLAMGSLSAISVRVVPFVGYRVAAPVALFVGAGLGADIVRFDPERAPPGATSTDGVSNADFVVTALAGVKLRLAKTIAARLGIAADVDATPRRYVTQLGPAREPLFELARVRPSAFLGFSFSFAGASQFGSAK